MRAPILIDDDASFAAYQAATLKTTSNRLLLARSS